MLKYDEVIFRQLINAKDRGRLSHAYLFCGDNLDKMYNTALMLACSLYTSDYESDTAKQILDGCHLNVTLLDINDGKQGISKEQITDLINNFSYTSMISGPRIYIIKSFDTASASAQNSLLKFIEEPGNDIYGFLLTSNKEGVLSTIKSRSVSINFKETSRYDIINSLDFDLDDNYILGTLIKNNIIYDINNEDYKYLKEIIYAFLNINNKVDSVIFKQKYNLNKDEFRDLLIVLIAIYEDSLDHSKLHSSFIYDKINKISQLNYNIIVKRLNLLLNILDKLNLNMNISSLVNNLMRNFF